MYEALKEIVAHIGAPHKVVPGDEDISGVRTIVSLFSIAAGEGDEEYA